jgi:hypothetical protein
VSSTIAPPPERSGFRLLRLEWWYDRLSEPRRLVLGLATIVLFGSASLYLLGLASLVLVNRADLASLPAGTEVQTSGTPLVILAESPQPPELEETAQPTSTSTPTPAVQTDGELIQAPEVPELPIYWSPPVIYKPRVVTETYDPPVAPTAPVVLATPVPTRAGAASGAISTPAAAPIRTATPGVRPSAPGQGVVATPNGNSPAVTAPRTTVVPPANVPTRAPVAPALATPNAPPLVPATRR